MRQNNGTDFLTAARKQMRYYRSLAETSVSRLDDEQLKWRPDDTANSVAIIMRHLAGNMLSRWTDFLSTDGEKPWRQRDEEFEPWDGTREELLTFWNRGWECFLHALDNLSEEDLQKSVIIRREKHSVSEAIVRQLAHYPYHVGQIVFISRMLNGSSWASLSIPRGGSAEFNSKKSKETGK
jgi:hypothetical protein